MKKNISIFILLILIFTLTGCGILKNESTNKTNDDDKIINKNKGEEDNMKDGKDVVLYFSATNITEKVAKKIAEVIESDIIEIIPKKEYTDDDLDYNNDDCRANKEQNDYKSRPEIKNDINIDQYKRIYIGYPIWWGTNPKIILTLIDKYNFDDKEIVLFCTSGSSGIETSVNELKKYNSKMNILDGKRFNSNVSIDEIKSWINSLN